MIEQRKIEKLVHRILSGKQIFDHDHIRYELVKPSLDIKFDADLLYESAYQDNLYSNFVFTEDLPSILIELGILEYNYKDQLKRLEKLLEKSKVNLYLQYFETPKYKKNKQAISNIRHDLDKLYNNLHILDHITLEHFCDNVKNEYILCNTLFLYDAKKLAFDYNEPINYNYFNTMASVIAQQIISIDTFKKIVRHEYWKNYWANNKYQILNEPVSNWSDEQKTLANISTMYDRIYEHPDCPPDAIIDDPDALDGWMIHQRIENEARKKEKGVDNMLGDKMKNASEVFIVAQNKDHADEILGFNNDRSLSTVKDKINYVMSSESPLRDAQLPDVKQKLIAQLKQQQQK